jgi:hypothetical protein
LRAIQEKGTYSISPVKEKMNIQELLIITKEIEKSPEIREAYLGISWLRLARFKAVIVPQ